MSTLEMRAGVVLRKPVKQASTASRAALITALGISTPYASAAPRLVRLPASVKAVTPTNSWGTSEGDVAVRLDESGMRSMDQIVTNPPNILELANAVDFASAVAEALPVDHAADARAAAMLAKHSATRVKRKLVRK